MTKQEMNLLTGCQSWHELLKKIGGHSHEESIVISIRSEITNRKDDGPGTVIFNVQPITIKTDFIKARAFEEA